MNTKFKTIAIGTVSLTVALMGTFSQANALTKMDAPRTTSAVVQEAAYTKLPSAPIIADTNSFNPKATIGIARLDKGRLIAAPLGEFARLGIPEQAHGAKF